MNWDNIVKILESYTQHKHLYILFDKFKLPRKSSKSAMVDVLNDVVYSKDVLFNTISEDAFYDWFSYHQIDGNNYSFVFNLAEKPKEELLKNLYFNRNNLISLKLWDIDPDNESETENEVMPTLTDVNLIGIHKRDASNSYVFSFIAPCLVTGKGKDSSQRVYKRIFFAHCVVSVETNDIKIIFNPTANLLNVNGIPKGKGSDWSPIADLFFGSLKTYFGDIKIRAPLWIPEALRLIVEEATRHNNPTITEHAFNNEDSITTFANGLMTTSGFDIEKDQAMLTRFIQDIQISFESQLIEKYGVNQDDMESFVIYRQRSDGVTHTIDVSSREISLTGSAAQAARRSRGDSDIDLLGIFLKKGDRSYKFLVEQGMDAYLVRGTNTFVEEEVVNIVVRRLNQYRDKIQSSSYNIDRNSTEDLIPST
jgi:hypothetical protein